MALFSTAFALALLLVATQARTSFKQDDFSTMIVGGDTAHLGQFPYHIYVNFNAIDFRASLVQVDGTQVVLTTARDVARFSPDDLTLRGGLLNGEEDNWETQSRKPFRIISHPDFEPSTYRNDIALLFIKEPFQRNENVNIVSLPDQFEEVTPGSNVTVTGWGMMAGGEHPLLLQYVQIPVVSNAQCNASWIKVNGTEILDSQLCTGDSIMIGSPCHYDGGGPAVTESGTLAGIVSWGKNDCAHTDTHPYVHIYKSVTFY